MIENLPRIIPKGYKAVVHRGTWDIPPIFSFLREKGNISEEEMLRTFNNGIGMILILDEKTEMLGGKPTLETRRSHRIRVCQQAEQAIELVLESGLFACLHFSIAMIVIRIGSEGACKRARAPGVDETKI
jgi:hypothetical protein